MVVLCLIFANIINDNENINKSIDKHIKLNPSNAINLNAVQIAFKVETKEQMNLNELINICILEFIKQMNNIATPGNESQAIQYINELRKELKQGGL